MATDADFEMVPVGKPPPLVRRAHSALSNPLGMDGDCLGFGAGVPSGWLAILRPEAGGAGLTRPCNHAVEGWVRVESTVAGQAYLGLNAAAGPGGNRAPVNGSVFPLGYWLGLGRSFPAGVGGVPGDPRRAPVVLRFCDGAGDAILGNQCQVLGWMDSGVWTRLRLEMIRTETGHFLRAIQDGRVLAELETAVGEATRHRPGNGVPGWALAGRERDRTLTSFIADFRWEAVTDSG